MVGQVGRERIERQLVGIRVRAVEPLREFPDRVVTRQEHDAALLQRGDAVVVRRECAVGRLVVLRALRLRGFRVEQRVGRKGGAGEFREAVFVPRGLVEQCEMRAAVRGRYDEEIRMAIRPDLRVQRIAHQVQPRAAELGVVPYLLRAAAVAGQFGERRMIPLVGTFEDHRHRLEVAPPRRGREAAREVGEVRGAAGQQRAGFGRGGASGARGGEQRGAGCEAECLERASARVPVGHGVSPGIVFVGACRVAVRRYGVANA
ncbi:hypothetical protein WL14_21350 [Burkholderia cepacia]|nr:hypothetical protein [Burkholderia cepacia]KVL15634.1 hypothetical protein WJ46_22425 [Burkholderia cepacia]KVQ33862.1 hypothetical protein WK02_08210 [Burkholderia cepacia]KVZ22068.1 hypothetical protein WL14_21350 [Burkholderia cepacia]